MRRFIAIIIALQCCLTPFCPAFAMQTIHEDDYGHGCASIQKEETHLSSATHSSLSCCTESKHASTLLFSEYSYHFEINTIERVHFQEAFLFAKTSHKKASLDAKHPPDDFERSSQSKRE